MVFFYIKHWCILASHWVKTFLGYFFYFTNMLTVHNGWYTYDDNWIIADVILNTALYNFVNKRVPLLKLLSSINYACNLLLSLVQRELCQSLLRVICLIGVKGGGELWLPTYYGSWPGCLWLMQCIPMHSSMVVTQAFYIVQIIRHKEDLRLLSAWVKSSLSEILLVVNRCVQNMTNLSSQ